MHWPDERKALWERVAANVHSHFGCGDAVEMPGSPEDPPNVGAALNELRSLLDEHDSPPFTYARLKDLVELGPEIQQEYAVDHGVAYLQAVLQLSNVTSSTAVFDDFDALLNTAGTDGIRLEPVTWAEDSLPQAVWNHST